MRKLIPLIVLTLLAGAVYTAYGVYSYIPTQLDPPQFDIERPDPDEIRRSIEQKQEDLQMSDELKAEKERIITRIREALREYRDFVDDVSGPAATQLQAFYKLMRNSQLPVFYPDPNSYDGQGKLSFTQLALDQVNIGRVREENSDTLECNASPGNVYNILVGSGTDNSLSCGVKPLTSGDMRIYIAGPGDDEIEDTRGHAFISAGSGDDIVTTGRGSTIIYVEPGWGTDTLNVSCEGARLDSSRFPESMPAPWKYQYANFIVFAPGIAPKDIAYKDGIVQHRNTDDKLILEENCFNYVFSDDLRTGP